MAIPLRSLVLCAALLGGCTSVVDPKKIEPALPATAADFCSSLRDALVARQGQCFGHLPEWARQEPSLPQCNDIAKAVSLGHIAYDQAAAYDCLAAIQQGSCDDVVKLALDVQPDFCAKALSGTVTTGACALDVECGAGRFCDASANTCPRGACQVRAAQDADCSSAACGPGLVCVNTAAGTAIPRCKPVVIAGPGAFCGGLSRCTSGTYCDTAATPNVCRVQRTSGVCNAQEQCAPGYRCALSVAGAGTCQRARALNAACTVGAQDCAVGSSCGAGSTCTLYPSGGAPCGLINGEQVGCSGATCSATASPTCVVPFVCRVP